MTYAEGLDLENDPDLNIKIRFATGVACDVIRLEAVNTSNHANRLIWAKKTLGDRDGMAQLMVKAVIAQNRALTVAQVQAATDAAIQTAVNAAVDLLAQ